MQQGSRKAVTIYTLNSSMSAKSAKELLKRYWGYDTFRPMQEEIINSVTQGNDTLVLMPTGGGKSLCYQIPALMKEGICLVVSPLISLMKDQVHQLHEHGIKAACLISGINGIEQEIVFNNCLHDNVKLLYVSPERLRQRVFIEHFRQMNISMIAVDEAHCISQWGYDFRPSYLEIANIRVYFPSIPIIALTATATPEVVSDIQQKLLFRPQKRLFQTSFSRGNLAYMVFHEMDKEGRMLRIIRKTGGCGIVYVRNRRRTREIAELLTHNGITAAYYHGGLEPKERNMAQARWMKGDVSVMVATNAFGMGIDKPDVRYVIHLDIPSSIEAYFQEAGRGGRDGKKSYAVMLYNESDLETLQQNFELSFPSRQKIANIYRAICNYYQLPVGSGENCQFDFDLEGLCATYHFNVLELYNATRFLEREGLLLLPEIEDSESKVYVPISREELYKFQVDQPKYSDLLFLLLRLYGGLFSDFVPISERLLARRMFMDVEQITNMLLHMDALKVIVYQPKKKRPQIVFSSPRIDAKDLYLSDSNYKELKEKANMRKEAMQQYVTAQEGCRSNIMLQYFGETTSDPCGVCDLCLTQHNHTKVSSIREQILQLLEKQPLRSDQLLELLPHNDEEMVKQELRQLVNEDIVCINDALQFTV